MAERTDQTDAPKRVQNRLAGAIYLVVFALLSTLFLSNIQQATQQRIADNELAERMKALQALLPETGYDNEPHNDFVYVTSEDLLGSDERLPVYRIRRDGQPIAAVVTAVAPNGFSGIIRMLVSIDLNGEIIAVRVVSHTETPGLGDRIEADKSDWIRKFSGLATVDPMAAKWALDRDGGTFDHLTGATVSSRAVLNAARNAVIYFNANRAELFSAPSESPPETDNP